MKDLTKGKPSTLILSFALPVFLGNLLQLTYSLADTRIVGSFLKEDALAAVGATSPLSGLIIGFLMGLANGFAIVTAQKFGAGNREEVRKSFALSLLMGSVISLALTVLGLLFLHPILGFLNVPDRLVGTARAYIFIIIAGMLTTFLYDTCAASLRALGDTVTPLVILAVSVTLNIAGDLFFILVIKAGVQGAAIATVLSQTLAFLVCWFYMIRRYEILRLEKRGFYRIGQKYDEKYAEFRLVHGICKFSCKSWYSGAADFHQPSGKRYHRGPYSGPQDHGDVYDHVWCVWADDGDLLRAECRGRADGPRAPWNRPGSSVYLYLVCDDSDLQFYYWKTADISGYRKPERDCDPQCNELS